MPSGETHSDLIGKKFGKLTPIEYVAGSKWKCICECGKECVVQTCKLNSRHTTSCGCVKKNNHFVHGKRKTRLYRIWANMKTRCLNPNDPHFERWGGRGITICQEWEHNFQAFYDWAISNGYSDDLSIDRIDVNGNYEPSNCRWATAKEQNNNKRNVKKVIN